MEGKRLDPKTSMPGWFYDAKEEFFYPIPCDFDIVYVNGTGEVKLKGPFRYAEPFKDGKARINLGYYRPDGEQWMLDLSGSSGTVNFEIDKGGHLSPLPRDNGLASATAGDTSSDAQDPVASSHLQNGTEPDRLEPVTQSGTSAWGYADENGQLYIPFQYGYAGSFRDGLSLAIEHGRGLKRMISERDEVVRKFGNNPEIPEVGAAYNALHRSDCFDSIAFINEHGKFIVPFDIYFKGKDFSEGLAAVRRENTWGYVDNSGSEVIPALYECARDFKEGLAAVMHDGKFGYIGKDGSKKIPFKFLYAGNFSEGVAPATVDGAHWGFIDKTGAFTSEPRFERTFEFSDGLGLALIPTRKISTSDRKEIGAFLRSGIRLLFNRELLEAAAALEVAHRLDPESIDGKVAMFVLKHMLTSVDIPKEALTDYQTGSSRYYPAEREELIKAALEKCPDFPWANVDLALIYLETGRDSKAIELLDSVSLKYPDFLPATACLANILKSKNQQGRSIDVRARLHDFPPEPAVYEAFKKLVPPEFH